MSGAPDIEAELMTAIGRARDMSEMLAPFGLPSGYEMTGVDNVEFFRAHRGAYYQPAENGRLALIVAVTEPWEPELVDLLAVDLLTQQVGLRLGVGKALGLDAIDDVRFNGGILHLVDQPFDWLHEPAGSAFVIDWTVAAFTLADLDRPVTTLAVQPIEVRCSMKLAERVERAFSRPLALPNLRVPT